MGPVEKDANRNQRKTFNPPAKSPTDTWAAEKDANRNQRKTFNPPAKSPTDTWVFSGGKKSGHSAPPTMWVKRIVTAPNQREVSNPNRYAYNNNYKGKHPMTKTQWRRYQRQKKADASKGMTDTGKTRGKQVAVFEMVKKPASERIFPLLSTVVHQSPKEDKEMTSNFSDSGNRIDIICNVVSILPVDYDVISEVNDVEVDFIEEMANHKPLCYYVMNDGCVENQHAIFEKPYYTMNHHLKPLFIQAKINGVGVNKALVDGGATVNLLPQSLLSKIGLSDTDLKPHNVVLTNYEGTTRNSLGDVEVELIVGSVSRTTMFMVVPSKANFNVLLGREWIRGVGAVPSTLHQRIAIWRGDGLVENIETDQSYFLAEVNNINKSNFDKHLANISPCTSLGPKYEVQDNEMFSMRLHPSAGFVWEREVADQGYVVVDHGEVPPAEDNVLGT